MRLLNFYIMENGILNVLEITVNIDMNFISFSLKVNYVPSEF